MANTPVQPNPRRGCITLSVVFGGLFLIFFAFVATMMAAVSDEGLNFGAEKIAIVEVVGPIMDSKQIVASLRKYRDDDQIAGIVVRVDSPGGAVAPSQEIYSAVRRAKKKKPLAISMGSTAASGGYYIAIGADKIFANPGTVTGSIGVITQIFNVEKILEKVELDVHTLKTGPYKDTGSMFREFNVRDEVALKVLIDDIYDQFVQDVSKGRDMPVEEVKKYADGRVFTGRQALEFKLVDELGTFEDAVSWVASEAKLTGKPKLVYPPKEGSPFADIIQGSVRSIVQEARTSVTPVVEYRYAP